MYIVLFKGVARYCQEGQLTPSSGVPSDLTRTQCKKWIYYRIIINLKNSKTPVVILRNLKTLSAKFPLSLGKEILLLCMQTIRFPVYSYLEQNAGCICLVVLCKT